MANDEYTVRVITRVKLPGFQSRHVSGVSMQVRDTDTFEDIIFYIGCSTTFYIIKKISMRIGGINYAIKPDANKNVLKSRVKGHLSTKEVPELIYYLDFLGPFQISYALF
jgi:hypothetical protein